MAPSSSFPHSRCLAALAVLARHPLRLWCTCLPLPPRRAVAAFFFAGAHFFQR